MKSLARLDLRGLRKQLRLSQESLARQIGVSLYTVHRWEKGVSEPSALAKRELALYLYREGLLPLGGAERLAGLSKMEFLALLAERNIPRHYTASDLEDDLEMVRQWRS